MTQQELNKRLDAYISGGAKALRAQSEKQESGYTEAEEKCKGCMGPCGMCEELCPEQPPLPNQQQPTSTPT